MVMGENPPSAAENSLLLSLIRTQMGGKKSSKNFQNRFLEFSPWFYYLHHFEWSHCCGCCSGSCALMAQGTAGGMQFLTTACSTQREHAGLLQGVLLVPLIPLPHCMCRSLCSRRNCISSHFPFWLFLPTVFLCTAFRKLK